MDELSYQPSRVGRRFRRRPYNEDIDFSVEISGHRERSAPRHRGTIYEISDGGVGIQATYPFTPGATLAFTLGDSVKKGIVKWVNKIDDQYNKAGLAFFADDLYGMQYPVELAAVSSEVKEDIEKYAGKLEAKTGEYIQALEALAVASASAADADSERILHELRVLHRDLFKVCVEFEKAAASDKAFIRLQRKAFQRKTDPILSKSTMVRHARTWPRGYQGDYKMLENIYKNMPLSEGLGYFLDQYGLSLPLAKAVRNRIMRLEEMVRQEILARNAASVLNIACGSCRELMGLAPDIANTNAKITCVDADVDALTFAMERLSFTEASENVVFRKYNAIRMFDDELNLVEFGKTDVIYSIGLFDYLYTDFLVKLFGALYRLLNDKGTLIAAFKDGEKYCHQDFHWITDWTGFLQRTEKEFQSIIEAAGIPRSAVRKERDDTGVIIFYRITKQ